MAVSTDNTGAMREAGAMRGADDASGLYRPSSERPKSPHIGIYRWPITMAMSFAHRATGAALYGGTFFLVVWLGALAWNAQVFSCVQAVYTSLFGRFILFLYTLALVHHMLGGIRHLFWDVNTHLLEKHCASKVAWATVFLSLIITALIWAVVCIWF